ncbi:U3 small nucleolar RNA-associated protein 14 homolog A [Nilaparvata lugens]|uniref:U3 small nucleolar RNA-associated protein 14 homolog A n=1 Tax=Nilaparvata lugens TaxID=108931 RepID=UPI00193E9846|nr:U3 small nucleolar RNA-associated protein 14 homolog A [Nilaparvata lugens]
MNQKLKRAAEIDDAAYNSDGFEEDDDIPENVHNRLLGAVSKLYKKKRVEAPTRKEPTLEVSEFHLTTARDRKKKNAVNVTSLTKVLEKKAAHKDIKKQITSAKNNSKRLDKPLEKLELDKVERAVGYENLKKDLGKWNAIVHHQRAAEQVSFPLPKSQEIQTWDDSASFMSKFKTPTLLEQQMAKILQASREYRNEVVVEEKVDKEPPIPLTLKEMMEQRALMAKTRAQRRYKETKAARQNKIKSKKFHRIQRKERIKAEMKDFEKLQKEDPEAALKKLDQLEKSRAQERASLRHRTTGHWAKSLQARAKYDKEARIALAEQLQKSRELTRRLKQDSSSDEEEEEEGVEFVDNNSDTEAKPTNNSEVFKILKPINNSVKFKTSKPNDNSETIKTSKPINNSETIKTSKLNNNSEKSKTSKPINNSGKLKTSKPTNNSETIKSSKLDIDDMFNKIEDKITEKVGKKVEKLKKQMEISNSLPKKTKNRDRASIKDDLGEGFAMKKKVVRSEIDEALDETTSRDSTIQTANGRWLVQPVVVPENEGDSEVENGVEEEEPKTTDIEPVRTIQVKPKFLKTVVPTDLAGGEDLDDEDNENGVGDEEGQTQNMTIAEAFADDDVVREFQSEKEDEIKKSKIDDVNLVLPGWGSWGGHAIKENKRKREKFIVKFPTVLPRRDENKGNVVINEDNDAPVKPLLVSDVPFPFTCVKDFEASIRAPIGSTFLPQKAFRKLTAPAVTTKMGTIIEPMSGDNVIKNMNT